MISWSHGLMVCMSDSLMVSWSVCQIAYMTHSLSTHSHGIAWSHSLMTSWFLFLYDSESHCLTVCVYHALCVCVSHSLNITQSQCHTDCMSHSLYGSWSQSHGLCDTWSPSHVPHCLILGVSVEQSLSDPLFYDHIASCPLVSLTQSLILGISWSHGLMVSQSMCLMVYVSLYHKAYVSHSPIVSWSYSVIVLWSYGLMVF